MQRAKHLEKVTNIPVQIDDYVAKMKPNLVVKRKPWTSLIAPLKKVKDSVHKSIWITATETKIIDSEEFQRLRYVRQTGPAYLLYPTAQHTRFDHSLGTLHIAQKMVDSINKSKSVLSDRDIFIIRLVALLHDLAHLPFGHSLEDEGRLFLKKQWLSKKRHGILLKNISQIIHEDIMQSFKDCKKEGDAEREAHRVLKQLLETLMAEEEGKVKKLDAPYIADIVGNTICADLLDYVQRDLFFCGLSGGYDELIFSYMTLHRYAEKNEQKEENGKKTKNEKKKKRLVIRLFKEKRGKEGIRSDVLTGLVDLLRTRYSIGERVYYHHTKREASAMVIKMVASALKAEIINEMKLCKFDDDSLRYYIREYRNHRKYRLREDQRKYLAIAEKLENCFARRELYKPVYEQSIVKFEHDDKFKELRDKWKLRYETEERLCELLGLDPGDILIYVPSEQMGRKQAKALVQLHFKYDGATDICSLEDLSHQKVQAGNLQDTIDTLKAELDALQDKHRLLWKLSVFVNPEVEYMKKQRLYTICEQWFENKTQDALVKIISRNHPTKWPSELICDVANGMVRRDATRTACNSLFSRYCDVIKDLLSSEKSILKKPLLSHLDKHHIGA